MSLQLKKNDCYVAPAKVQHLRLQGWASASAVIDDEPIVNGSSDDALKTMQMVYRIYCADAEWKARWDLSDGVPAIE